MKSQLYMFTAALMIEQAMPACAQQISEQEANQAAKSITDVLDKALHEKDAAGAVALFTKNAIRVTAEGPQIGRQEIENAFTGLFKVYTSEFDKIDQVTVISNDVVGSVNRFAGTYSGPKGAETLKGYATFIYVREGNTWKIRMETVSIE